MKEVGRQHHAHHLVIEIGEDLLEAIPLVAPKGDDHMINPASGKSMFQVCVSAQAGNAILGALRNSIGNDTHHMQARVRIVVNPSDDFIRQATAPYHKGEAAVVTFAPGEA